MTTNQQLREILGSFIAAVNTNPDTSNYIHDEDNKAQDKAVVSLQALIDKAHAESYDLGVKHGLTDEAVDTLIAQERLKDRLEILDHMTGRFYITDIEDMSEGDGKFLARELGYFLVDEHKRLKELSGGKE